MLLQNFKIGLLQIENGAIKTKYEALATQVKFDAFLVDKCVNLINYKIFWIGWQFKEC